jgi:hypothetical protein
MGMVGVELAMLSPAEILPLIQLKVPMGFTTVEETNLTNQILYFPSVKIHLKTLQAV